MSEKQALESMKGKVIESIQHHEVIGSIQFHFTDGSTVQVFAQEKASQQIMIIEPNTK
ncbi:hypothetical protein [Pseudoalteromonas piratica]|uniref:hypothetical protein n=1 Tax=Pseudoalteromonas piratica TaxID=1348114 RepID=UPI000AC31E33|nr:hypothetical protein [Pseudoalteromonas piratica]